MPVTCTHCNKEFISQAHLKRHQNAKTPCTERKSVYICDICGYITKDKTRYKKHCERKTDCSINRTTNLRAEIQKDLEEKFDVKTRIMEEKYNEKIKKLEKKVNDKKRNTINYNFIVNNFDGAFNIEDCMNPENITQDILDKCRRVPLKDGAIYILDSLCNIDPVKRPIHCTDASRLNFLIKSENDWMIDSNAEKIKSHMNPVVASVYNTVHGEKLNDKNRSIEEKLLHMDTMSKELNSASVNKSCSDAIKKTTSCYLAKNLQSTDILLNDIDE